jgi:hypothetical protein
MAVASHSQRRAKQVAIGASDLGRYVRQAALDLLAEIPVVPSGSVARNSSSARRPSLRASRSRDSGVPRKCFAASSARVLRAVVAIGQGFHSPRGASRRRSKSSRHRNRSSADPHPALRHREESPRESTMRRIGTTAAMPQTQLAAGGGASFSSLLIGTTAAMRLLHDRWPAAGRGRRDDTYDPSRFVRVVPATLNETRGPDPWKVASAFTRSRRRLTTW